MAEFYDDRRQEPRFPTRGEGEVEIGGVRVRGDLVDLSINGLKMRRPEGFGAPDGSRFPLTLLIPGFPPFAADVLLVRTSTETIGVEFMDMPPRDFATLTALIDGFHHRHTLSQMDADGPTPGKPA